MMFSKEEQGRSLVYRSARSSRQPLDEDKVDLLFSKYLHILFHSLPSNDGVRFVTLTLITLCTGFTAL